MSEVVQLATSDDVKAILGRDLTSEEAGKVDAILDKASEMFRRRSGQQFTPGESTVRRIVSAGRATLPQRPVTAVISVIDDCDGDPIRYTLVGDQLRVHGVRSGEFVHVHYEHGGDVPDVVRLQIADLARRVLEVSPKAISGVTQHGETTGPFTEQDTYAAWAVGGQTMLSPDDIALADSYRKAAPRAIILDAPARTPGWLR